MKILSSGMISLLDKLYNLRGEDSKILKEMDASKEEAIKTKEKTELQISELEEKINVLADEENLLSNEGDKLLNALASIRNEEFQGILEHLNINFNPEMIKREVENKLPATIKKVALDIESAKNTLLSVENEMNDAIVKIEELGIRKDEALKNQEKLNHYFSLALDNNINITRDELTSLLKEFNFTEEEQREAAKLLMFPEDGLFEYETNKSHRQSVRSIGDVIHSAIDESSVKEETEKPVIEPQFEKKIVFSNEITKEDLASKLNELGFDYLDFTSNDFTKMIDNYNEELFRNNAVYLLGKGVDKDIFNDNVELFYDNDLINKVDMLLNIGKTVQDIYLNPGVIVKYNFEELKEAIKMLKESGLDPKNVPLMAY